MIVIMCAMYHNSIFSVILSSCHCLDIQCATLPLSDGLKVSCDSTYTAEFGYEGDTCTFTCNPGYEFSGSHTRTCQSDGSWSGSEAICIRGLYQDTR